MACLRYLIPLFAIMLSSCDDNNVTNVSVADTACVTHQTQILIGDGYFKSLCGCDENSNDVIVSGQTLTCTVASGTTLFFLFNGNKLKHQILSTGTPSFGSGPLSDPATTPLILNYTLQMDTRGSYSFFDPFNPGITGALIVR